jgi:hypothetical protein
VRIKNEKGRNRIKNEKRLKRKGKKKIFYSGFTFQNTAAAATFKTNTPTAENSS